MNNLELTYLKYTKNFLEKNLNNQKYHIEKFDSDTYKYIKYLFETIQEFIVNNPKLTESDLEIISSLKYYFIKFNSYKTFIRKHKINYILNV